MAHAVESMAYFDAVPWHGLGTDLTGERRDDWRIVSKAAGMDWNVLLNPMYTEVDGEVIEIPGKFAAVRDKDRKVLGTVGSSYSIVQNSEMFEFAENIVRAGGGDIQWDTAGSLWGGTQVWVLCRAPVLDFEVVEGDSIHTYVMVTNTHDGSRRLTAMLTRVRVVCNNTLTWAMGQGSEYRIDLRHTGTPTDKIDQAVEALGIFSEATSLITSELKRLTQQAFSIAQMRDFTDTLLGIAGKEEVSTRSENIRDTLVGLYSNGRGVEAAPETKWAAYNAVTEYVTHARSTRGAMKRLKAKDDSLNFLDDWGNLSKEDREEKLRIGEREARLESSWFGSGKAMVERAQSLLVDA